MIAGPFNLLDGRCWWRIIGRSSPPDVIAAEIVEVLEAALEQFRLIAADLRNGDWHAGQAADDGAEAGLPDAFFGGTGSMTSSACSLH